MFINKRDQYVDQYGNVYDVEEGFWYSNTGHILKWVLFLLIFAFIIYIFAGYTHARKRASNGLPLLAYHRWLVPRSRRSPRQHQPGEHFTFYQTPNHNPDRAYHMHSYPGPPPVYNNDLPPQYQYPEEAGKIPQAQSSNAAPQGVPQGAQQTGVAEGSGGPQLPPRAVTKATNAFRWLKR